MIREILLHAAGEAGLVLSDENIRSFELFADELKKWNSRVNLTAITADNEIAIKHFMDSLSLLPYLSDEDTLLDIGSGAGFPVIPLKIARPGTAMLSVDAVAKKIDFQRHMIRILGLQEIKAIHARGEDLHEGHEKKFSLVTSRAFSRLEHFVSLAGPLLAKGGRLIAMKGADVEDEIAAGKDTLKKLGFKVAAIHCYSLPLDMGRRSLVVLMRRESPCNKL